MEMWLNGAALDIEFDGETASYTPQEAFAAGSHTLEVIATDLSGLTTSESYAFTVPEESEASPDSPQTDEDAAESPLPGALVLLVMAAAGLWSRLRQRSNE